MDLSDLAPVLPFLARLVSGGVATAGAFVLARAVVSWRRAEASRSWPFTMGEVVESRVREKVLRESPRITLHWYVGEDGEPFVAFSYRYSVDGTTYRGSRTSFGDDYGRSYDRTLVERYPVGSAVRVHYDPRNPSICVLEPGPDGAGNLVLTLLGLALLGIGIVLAIRSWAL